jgi:hypothetical protein
MLSDTGIFPSHYALVSEDIAAKKEDILASEQQHKQSGNILQQALFVGFLAALDIVERCQYDSKKVIEAAHAQLLQWIDKEHDAVCQGFIACFRFLDARIERSRDALMRCLQEAVQAYKQLRDHWHQQNIGKQRNV